ncbi:MAG TPA: hypothetical protein VKU00_15000, partial [Chthonomonadaceae bacterium]|nr:hypothetical protein [Chthonomonadaceae bacterium]
VQGKLRQLANDLRQNNVSYPQYLAQIGQTQEQHQAHLFAQSEAQIRSLLALRQIAITEELQTDDKAINAHFDRMRDEGRLTEEQYDEFKGDPARRQQVASALIQQALHDFLFANNTVVEVEQPAVTGEEGENSTEPTE